MEDSQRVLLQRTLIRVKHKLMKLCSRHLEEFGISGPEYGILRNLNGESLTLSELSQCLLKVNSNITALIDHLERRGLVERTRDPADRRVVRVRLTEDGFKLREQAVPAQNRFIAALLAPLADADVAQLQTLLLKLEEICDGERERAGRVDRE